MSAIAAATIASKSSVSSQDSWSPSVSGLASGSCSLITVHHGISPSTLLGCVGGRGRVAGEGVVVDGVVERREELVHALPIAYVGVHVRVEIEDVGQLGLHFSIAEVCDIWEAVRRMRHLSRRNI